MKAILEFNLPEDICEYRSAINGGDWKTVVWDIDQWLRVKLKHHSDSMSDEEYNTLEKVRAKLSEVLDEYYLTLYD